MASSTDRSALITIKTAEPQPDPSGGKGKAVAVEVTPEYCELHSQGQQMTRLAFEVVGPGVKKITGLRYMNTSKTLAGEWFMPEGSPEDWNYREKKWPIDHCWTNLKIVTPTMVTVDFPKGDEVYRYVVEWEEDYGAIRVCDPMIRNEG